MGVSDSYQCKEVCLLLMLVETPFHQREMRTLEDGKWNMLYPFGCFNDIVDVNVRIK